MPLHQQIVNKLSNTNCNRAELDEVKLTKEDIVELVLLLKNSPHVTHLSLRRNNLTSGSLLAFEGMPLTVKYIDLSENDLDDEVADIILQVFSSVQELDVSSNALTNESAKKFSTSANQSYLKIVGNTIDSEHQRLIHTRIQQNNRRNSIAAVNGLVERSILTIQAQCEILTLQQQVVFLEELKSNISILEEQLSQQTLQRQRMKPFFSSSY